MVASSGPSRKCPTPGCPQDRSRPQPRSGRRLAPSLDRSEDSPRIERVMARGEHGSDVDGGHALCLGPAKAQTSFERGCAH